MVIEFQQAGANQPSSFFRTMLALAALDVVMLFWILNPLAKPANSLTSWRVQPVATVNAVAKPSPLGPARKYNSPDERRLVAVAYRH
jgi:hypothetical protein